MTSDETRPDAPPLRPDVDLIDNAEGNEKIKAADKAAAQAHLDALPGTETPPAAVPVPDAELAHTDNPGDDLDPADLKLADPDPKDTPNPYTGENVGPQDDEAVHP